MAAPDRFLDRRDYRDLLFTLSAVGVSFCLLWMSWHLRRQTDWLDMRIYRNAIDYWAHGHGLYTFEQPGTRNHLGFTYPPFGAIVLAPLAAMSLGQAELIFTVVNVLICVACGSGFGMALARRFGWPRWPSAVLGSAIVLSLEPVRESLGFGQINLVLLGLLAADMWLLSTGRRGGALIGLAAAIKLTPAVLILALFASGRRDAGRRALAASAGVTALAAVVMPESSWQFWTREVWRTSRVGRPDRITNQSWTGVLARLGVEATLSKALWLLGGMAAVAVALAFARRAEGWWSVVRVLVVAAAASTFASPISWTHHYWWAVPAVAALLYRAVETRSAAAIACFATVFAMFAFGPLKVEHMVHRWQWASAISGDLYLYASVVTCIGLCLPTRRTAPARIAELSVVGAADVDVSRGEQARGERSREHQHSAD